MRTIARMFGHSPFVPLQTHMEKVAECVGKLPDLFQAYHTGDTQAVAKLAETISKLEHEADLIKHDIRNSLPRGLFLPVARANLLAILGHQDGLANRAENIGVLLTLKQAHEFDTFRDTLDAFVAKCLEAVESAHLIIGQVDELIETGFGGAEAAKVREMIDHVARIEFDSDRLQHKLIRELLVHEDELSYGDFFLWTRVIRQLSQLADRSENLANAVQTTFESR